MPPSCRLLCCRQADIIEDDGTTVLRIAQRAQPVVIRLRYVVKVPYHRRTAMSRRAVFVRDEHSCQYCGDMADSIDHIMPRSRGGQHIWENVAAACRPCNLRKRDRTPDEAGMRLARPPRAPKELGLDHGVGHRGRRPGIGLSRSPVAMPSWNIRYVPAMSGVPREGAPTTSAGDSREHTADVGVGLFPPSPVDCEA